MRIGLLSLALLWPFAAGAEVYKWIDDRGTVHYSEVAPPVDEATVVRIDAAPAGAGGDAGCNSWECYARTLEQQRLERERGYATRDAEQARIETEHRQRQARAEAAAAKDKRAKSAPTAKTGVVKKAKTPTSAGKKSGSTAYATSARSYSH